MSTDSTELTFVRCPSCRSLVPAVSTRCRMCGASLDSGAQAEEEKDSRKSGRVRQRTMSQPKSELSSAAGQARENDDPIGIEETDPLAYTEEGDDISAGDDPLSAYIEEVEGEVEAAPKQAKPVDAPKATPAAPNEPAWQKVAPAPKQAEPVAPVSSAPVVNGASEMDDAKPEGDEPRVIIESGARRGGKPGGLSFGGGKQRDERQADRPREDKPREERPRQEQSEQRQARTPENREPQGRPEAPKPQQPAQDNRDRSQGRDNRDNRRDRDQRDSRESRDHGEQRGRDGRENREPSRDQQSRQQAPAPQQKAQQTGPRRAESNGRRLFGWLVSYTNSDGQATELREGKFFVTRSSLKENDLILDDNSISTPHAMVVVSFEGGFTIQDLMSERGIAIRRKGSDRYESNQETIKPGHGDWIRFGDVEYLVSFIAESGK